MFECWFLLPARKSESSWLYRIARVPYKFRSINCKDRITRNTSTRHFWDTLFEFNRFLAEFHRRGRIALQSLISCRFCSAVTLLRECSKKEALHIVLTKGFCAYLTVSVAILCALSRRVKGGLIFKSFIFAGFPLVAQEFSRRINFLSHNFFS